MSDDSASPSLRALGESAEKNGHGYRYDKVDPSLLEKFKRPENRSGSLMSIGIEVPEFTCLCPITGQPDFAQINITYTPKEWCVESKSLKLYMGSFRNVGTFHEACCQRILDDLVSLLDPQEATVFGDFAPRGGIPFKPLLTYKKLDGWVRTTKEVVKVLDETKGPAQA